jgi:cation transport regulator ChaC
MFQTQKHIERRTGKSGTSRLQYLTELVKEYQNLGIASSSISRSNINNEKEVKNLRLREQVLANLANFAYG